MINIERVYKTTLYIGSVIILVMAGVELFTHYDIAWYGYLLPFGVPTVLFIITITIALCMSHRMANNKEMV
tara:strand:+ start:360 stop:572 length:213 start_codon:yes stop_codon:yes gene_type:complete